MKPIRRAVIDVGTNSIKLLVADVEGHRVEPVWEGSRQTRLGRGFYESHRLQAGAIDQTAKAVAEFVAQARRHKADSIRVIATSAARDAINAHELTAAIQRAAGMSVEIISGDEEADLVFHGVTTDPELARRALLLLGVGGGGTEFIVGQGGHKHFRASFPLGSVRLMETVPHSDPPKAVELAACREWVERFLRTEVEPKLGPVIRNEKQRLLSPGNPDNSQSRHQSAALGLVGTGGAATVLARMESQLKTYDRTRIEATRLSLERMRWHVQRLWSMPLEKRKLIIGLPGSRADVILTGALIYETVMDLFGFDQLRVSTRGLRFAAMMVGNTKREA